MKLAADFGLSVEEFRDTKQVMRRRVLDSKKAIKYINIICACILTECRLAHVEEIDNTASSNHTIAFYNLIRSVADCQFRANLSTSKATIMNVTVQGKKMTIKKIGGILVALSSFMISMVIPSELPLASAQSVGSTNKIKGVRAPFGFPKSEKHGLYIGAIGQEADVFLVPSGDTSASTFNSAASDANYCGRTPLYISDLPHGHYTLWLRLTRPFAVNSSVPMGSGASPSAFMFCGNCTPVVSDGKAIAMRAEVEVKDARLNTHFSNLLPAGTPDADVERLYPPEKTFDLSLSDSQVNWLKTWWGVSSEEVKRIGSLLQRGGAVTVGGDRYISINAEGKLAVTYPGPKRVLPVIDCGPLVFWPDSTLLLVCDSGDRNSIKPEDKESKTYLLNTKTWNIERKLDLKPSVGKDAKIQKVALSPKGTLLATMYESALCIWDTRTWQMKSSIALNRGGARLSFSSDEKLLACSSGTSILLWDMQSDALRKIETGGYVYDVCFAPDRPNILAAIWQKSDKYSFTHEVGMWDVGTGKVTTKLNDVISYPFGHHPVCVFSPDGSQLAILGETDFGANREHTIIDIYDSRSGATTRQMTVNANGNNFSYSPVSFFGAGKSLAYADGRLTIFDGVSGLIRTEITPLFEPDKEVAYEIMDVVGSPDGKTLVCVMRDCPVGNHGFYVSSRNRIGIWNIDPSGTTLATNVEAKVGVMWDDEAPQTVSRQNSSNIQSEIDAIRQESPALLPSPTSQAGPNNATKAVWMVTNRTSSAITILISAPAPLRVVLQPNQTEHLLLDPGTHDVAVRCSQPNIKPLLGSKTFSASFTYSSEFHLTEN